MDEAGLPGQGRHQRPDQGRLRGLHDRLEDRERAEEHGDGAQREQQQDRRRRVRERLAWRSASSAALQKVGLAGTVPVERPGRRRGQPEQRGQGPPDGRRLEGRLRARRDGRQRRHPAVQQAPLADVKAPVDLEGSRQACALGPPTSRRRVHRHHGTAPNGPVVKSIVLKPTPVTAENLNVPLDLGWITKESSAPESTPPRRRPPASSQPLGHRSSTTRARTPAAGRRHSDSDWKADMTELAGTAPKSAEGGKPPSIRDLIGSAEVDLRLLGPGRGPRGRPVRLRAAHRRPDPAAGEHRRDVGPDRVDRDHRDRHGADHRVAQHRPVGRLDRRRRVDGLRAADDRHPSEARWASTTR